MHTHKASCLAGPLTGGRTWWRHLTNETPAQEGKGKEELFRAALVERIRGEIAAGTYDTPEKWEAALERLSQRLDAEEV
jgi:hypothetical protein